MATSKGPSKTPKQQLSASMEHIRYAISADPTPRPDADPTSPTSASTAPDPSSRIPNAQKRTDPFQFGSRYLEPDDDPFAFNAWDHVSVTPEYLSFADAQYAFQRSAPVSDFDKKRFNGDPAKFWNAFYNNNSSNFFKDRKWLNQEFPILGVVTKKGAGKYTILEVGAGAGNTAYPILKGNENEELKVHACDFSKTAVAVMRGSEDYNEKHMQADVWDAASTELPPGLGEASVDIVIMVFIFSALAPSQWEQCVRNIFRVLKPGGCVLFRDYGRGDLAQVRFKKGRYLEENFYIRGDGTRVYFFEKDELEQIWTGKIGMMSSSSESQTATPSNGTDIREDLEKLTVGSETSTSADANTTVNECPKFEIINLGVDRRMLVNRQRKLKMYRCWMQAVFRKPGPPSLIDSLPKDAISRPHNSDEAPAMAEATTNESAP